MLIEIESSKAMAHAVKVASRFCEKRSNRPSWELIMFELNPDGYLYAHCHNARSELRLVTPGNGTLAPIDKQRFLMRSELIANVVGACEEPSMLFSVSESVLTVRWAGTEYELITSDVEFTSVEPFDCRSYAMLQPRDFLEAIRRVAFCTDDGGGKYNLDSIYAAIDGDDLVVEASDGRSAIRTKCKCVKLGNIKGFEIPKDAVKYLDAFVAASPSESMLQVGFDDRVHLRHGNSTARILVDSGKRPDLDRFFKIPDANEVHIDSSELLAAVNQIDSLLDVETMGCRIDVDNLTMKLSAGKSTITLNCMSQWTFGLTIDCQILRTFLSGTPANTEICFYFVGDTDPLHILYGETHFLVMPMQVK